MIRALSILAFSTLILFSADRRELASSFILDPLLRWPGEANISSNSNYIISSQIFILNDAMNPKAKRWGGLEDRFTIFKKVDSNWVEYNTTDQIRREAFIGNEYYTRAPLLAISNPYYSILFQSDRKIHIGKINDLDSSFNIIATIQLDFDASVVKMDGDTLAIGAPTHPNYPNGAVIIYRKEPGSDTWSFHEALTQTDLKAGDQFGYALDLACDKLMIGAPNADRTISPTKANTGRVAIYSKKPDGKWNFEANLYAYLGETGDKFGQDVANMGHFAVVSVAKYGSTNTKGAAILFKQGISFSNWQQETTYTGDGLSSTERYAEKIVASDTNFAIPVSTTSPIKKIDIFEYSNASWVKKETVVQDSGFYTEIVPPSIDFSDNFLAFSAKQEYDIVDKVGYAFEIQGSKYQFSRKFNASISSQNPYYAKNILVKEPFMFVSAPDEDELGQPANNKKGKVYIYKKSGTTWSLHTTLQPGSDLSNYARFGESLAFMNNTLVIGAPDNNKVFIYAYNSAGSGSWTKTNVLQGGAGTRFGSSVALYSTASESVLVVGAPDTTSFRGAIHIFKKAGSIWPSTATQYALHTLPSSFFGFSLDINDSKEIIVGAYGEDSNGSGSGIVYYYKYDPATLLWVGDGSFRSSDNSTGDFFGYSVKFHQNQIFVGAIGASAELMRELLSAGSDVVPPSLILDNPGAVYIFSGKSSGFQQLQKISSGRALHDNFGYSLSAQDNRLLIGAPGVDFDPTNRGAAYLYLKPQANWEFEHRFTSPYFNTEASDYFGFKTAMSADEYIVANHRGDAGKGYAVSFKLGQMMWVVRKDYGLTQNTTQARFGEDASISNNRLAVATSDKKSLLIYTKTNDCGGWVQTHVINFNQNVTTPFLIMPNSLHLEDDHVIFGTRTSDMTKRKVLMYHYEGNNWEERGNFQENNQGSGSTFGHQVQLTNNLALFTGNSISGVGNVIHVARFYNGTWGIQELLRITGNALQPQSFFIYFQNNKHYSFTINTENSTLKTVLMELSLPANGTPPAYWNVVGNAAVGMTGGLPKMKFDGEHLLFLYTSRFSLVKALDNTFTSWSAWPGQYQILGTTSFRGIASSDDKFYISSYFGLVHEFIKTDTAPYFIESGVTYSHPSNSTLEFGYSLGYSNNTLFIGCPKDNAIRTNSGSLFFYSLRPRVIF